MHAETFVQESVRQWRKWLIESQTFIVEIEQQLSAFVEAYDSSEAGNPLTKQTLDFSRPIS